MRSVGQGLRRERITERAAILRRPATYADVLAAPPHMVAEIIEGALHLHLRPASRHARASFRLAGRLDDPFENGVGGPGGWWFASGPELHLDANVLAPDLCGWRRERMPDYPDAPFFSLAPDWVCEILSPSTREHDLTEKRALYAGAGAAHLWHVDPGDRTLETFALEAGRWIVGPAFHGAAEVEAPPFEALRWPLAALWPPEREDERG